MNKTSITLALIIGASIAVARAQGDDEKHAPSLQRMMEERIKASSSLRKLFEGLLKDFEEGSTSLDRLILSQRSLLELDMSPTGKLTVETFPQIFERHSKLALKIEKIAASHVKEGKISARDLQFATAHRKLLEFKRLEAKAKLAEESKRRRVVAPPPP